MSPDLASAFLGKAEHDGLRHGQAAADHEDCQHAVCVNLQPGNELQVADFHAQAAQSRADEREYMAQLGKPIRALVRTHDRHGQLEVFGDATREGLDILVADDEAVG